MGVPSRYILHQGPVLGALLRGVLVAARQTQGSSSSAPTVPGKEIVTTLPPRRAELVRDYVRHVGGDPGAYKREVPAHLFPQWVFPVQARTLEGLSYPMQKVLNGGCRLEFKGPIPQNEPLTVRGWLEDVDDDGRRAVLHQVAVTGTKSVPEAIVSHMYAIVPLGGRGDGASGARSKKDKPRVPDEARELQRWRLGPKAGLDFAKLTGDFNPVHWVSPYARAFGFPSVILHGFSTMARAIEGLHRSLFAGDVHALASFDCRFTRPLVLPARVGLYVLGQQVFVGDAPGGPAYLVGSFETRRTS